MMKKQVQIFQIDAFTDRLFGGNPAAVCPLEEWLFDDQMRNIAIENNLAETAFFVPLENGHFQLRWFTPNIEMDLCGHATLASAFVIFSEMGYTSNEITFESRSGMLKVRKDGEFLVLNFPSRPAEKASLPLVISDALSIQPEETWKERDYMLVYNDQKEVENIIVDTSILNQINLDPGGIIITAPGHEPDVDFVSRYFTPQSTILEDPVTGSAHCTLIPYWSDRLGKNDLAAVQVSARRGELFCSLKDNRVDIKGKAVKYLQGFIYV